MKRVKEIGARVGGAIVGAAPVVVGAASVAHAEDIFTAPTFSTTTLGAMATAILGLLAGIWAYRKAVKSVNRS